MAISYPIQNGKLKHMYNNLNSNFLSMLELP